MIKHIQCKNTGQLALKIFSFVLIQAKFYHSTICFILSQLIKDPDILNRFNRVYSHLQLLVQFSRKTSILHVIYNKLQTYLNEALRTAAIKRPVTPDMFWKSLSTKSGITYKEIIDIEYSEYLYLFISLFLFIIHYYKKI